MVGSENGAVAFDAADSLVVDTRVEFEALANNDINLTSRQLDFDTFLFDVSSVSDTVTVEVSAGDISISGNGGQLFTSTGGNSIDVSETLNIDADDVFSIFQEILVEADTITFNGDWEFGATISRDGTVTFDGEDLQLSAFDGNFIGGLIDIEIGTTFDVSACPNLGSPFHLPPFSIPLRSILLSFPC